MIYVHLYEHPSAKTLNLSDIVRYLSEKLGKAQVDLRSEFVNYHVEDFDDIAMKMADIKVRDINQQHISFEPLYGEIEYEKSALKDIEKRSVGVLYDGYKLHNIFWEMIDEHECTSDNIHIIFTNRLLGTWDEDDHRYHARVIICGYLCIISIPGIIEAPAMPKEFYILKQKYAMAGIPIEVLKNEFKGRFIEYDDIRMTEIMKGYVMQAIFYHFTHEAFCIEKSCRLYNAHWQEEVLHAQLNPLEFCEKHEEMLSMLVKD